MTSWFVVQKTYSKMHLVSCTNTHCDVTNLVNHRMVKNTKTWISWERNIIFVLNKKILNLCFRWHLLRSYHFVAEVTFNDGWTYFSKRNMHKHFFSLQILYTLSIKEGYGFKNWRENHFNVVLFVHSPWFNYISVLLLLMSDRISCLVVFYEKCVLKNFAKFTEKHMCLSLLTSNKTDSDTGVLWILQNF